MPGSVTAMFSEPADFEAALREGGCLSLLILGRGQFWAQLTRVTLHSLRLLAVEEHQSRIVFVAAPTDMVIVALPIGNAAVPVRGRVGPHPGEIMILPPGGHLHVRTEDGLRRWGSIWIPVVELVQYSCTLTETPFALPPVAQRWRPPPSARRRLRSLHAAAMRMAAIRPQLLVNAQAAHGLEQQLIHALVECLSTGSGEESTLIERGHRDVMVRFERLLQALPDHPDMTIREMCAALDVSERLLSRLCAEHLGMRSTDYVRRRMSQVRRA